MSVGTYSLADTITVTPAAAKHFRDQLGRSGALGVRISLKESGCSGFKYEIEEIDVPAASDISIKLENDVVVCFKPADAVALRGTQIDYTIEGLNRNLKIENPNAVDACGCGESFNIDLTQNAGQ